MSDEQYLLVCYLEQKYPQYQFSIGNRTGQAQRLYNNGKWLTTCKHAVVRAACKLCNGKYVGKYRCPHRLNKSLCVLCDGAGLCEHKRSRSQCSQCNECEHGVNEYYCRICKGGGVCDHRLPRRICKKCDGRSLCIECGERWTKTKGGFCISCDPSYVPSGKGISKIGCRWIDELTKELGVTIQHGHYDIEQPSVAEEYRPQCLPRGGRVDGYLRDSNEVFEFLGDEWHGHPSLWVDEHNHKGDSYERLFSRTEVKLSLLAASGYTVRYIWESEFLHWKKRGTLTKLSSITRTFNGSLEYAVDCILGKRKRNDRPKLPDLL